MIEWQEHSTESERHRLADELDVVLTELYAAQREEQAAQRKLERQRKPENVVKATQALQTIQQRVARAQAAHTAAVRTMCAVHVDINIDDVVELVNANGNRLRDPIIVDNIEFVRKPDRSFWLRVHGFLLEESDSGRPQLTQSFDLNEHDASRRLVKHN